MKSAAYDVAVVGGGIIGLATARALLHRLPDLRLVLFEKESRLAFHQTGRNSGVVHSGVYYRSGSLKARLCTEGVRLLEAYCVQHGISFQRSGKVIIAVEENEVPVLEALYRQGLSNGVPDIRLIGPQRLKEIEPHAQGVRALHLPRTAIVDFTAVASAMARETEEAGGRILLDARVAQLQKDRHGWQIATTRGDYAARLIVNCGGLFVDRIGRMAGHDGATRIVPFRGEYYRLTDSRASLVKGLVYPVPDPSMPFLGVHFTPTLSGSVHVGPNAVMALKREGYHALSFSLRDVFELISSAVFWRMAGRYWKAGLKEAVRSFSKSMFLHDARRLVPALESGDLARVSSGVRAQAVCADGLLAHDFILHESPDAVHVYNAPSPAATASLSIGQYIAGRVSQSLDMRTEP